MTSAPITARSLATLKTASAVVLGLAVGFVALGGIPQADAICAAPPRYDKLEAQIDEISADDSLECLVVEHEVVSDAETGFITIVTDFANACGEDVWIASESRWHDPAGGFRDRERVADGEMVTVRIDVEQHLEMTEGDGELEFGVLTDSEGGGASAPISGFAPLSRVAYSYEGMLRDNSDFECNDTDSGCAATAPASPAKGPLSWVMLGLGLVWIGRRSTLGRRA